MDRNKIKDSRIAIHICAFILPFVMMQIFWAVCKIYPYGPGSILTGDMNIEFVNFYSYFINTLKTNNDWSYMLTKTLGGDYPGLAAFILQDPLLYVLLLFPGENIAFGIQFMFSLQVSIAGLSASILLNNRYRRSWTSLLFSTGYAFASFFFGYLVLTIYFGALAILPLVLYFFLKYLDDGKSFTAFIISASIYIYVNYHMGFMLVIFLVILYISRIIVDTSYIRRVGGLAVSGITVLLIDGLVLIRTGLSLMGEKTTVGADYGLYRRFPLNELFAGLFSGCARNDLRPLIYCSVAVFFFAVVYFLSGKYSIREKIANAFVIAVVAVSMWINTLDTVWHGFNNPEGFWWRYAYYISITLVVLGYKGFTALTDEESGSNGKTGNRLIAFSALILFAYMAWLTVTGSVYFDRTRLVINAALTILIAATAFIMINRRKMMPYVFALLLVISACDMIYDSKTAYMGLNSYDGYLPEMASFKEDYRNIDDVISYVKSQDSGFYRIEKDFDRGVNDPSMFDYIGLSHDSSCEKDALLEWLVNFGFCKTVYFTYYNGGSTAFVDDLFGIRYYISRFDSIEKPYEKMSYSGTYHAYRNEDALPLAFVAPGGLGDIDINEGDTFEKQNAIASCWNRKDIYIKAEPEVTLEGAVEEEPGRYVRTEDEGYIIYTIPVTNDMPLYFYFYAPGRQNGEVFVNGESADVYFTVNHWNTLCAGKYDIGDRLEIRMKISDDELVISKACFCYEDAGALSEWGTAARALNGQIGEVEKIKSSHLTFTTDCEEESGIAMSIPYDPSWTITCDGKELTGYTVLEQLMGFDVPAGHHVIDMVYTPEGTGIGSVVTVVGFIMLLILILTKGKPSLSEKLLKSPKIEKIKK